MQIKIILSKQIKVLYCTMCTVCTYGAAIFFLKFVNASFSVHIAEKSQQCCMVLLGPKIILNLRIKTWVCHGRNRCNGLCLVSDKDRAASAPAVICSVLGRNSDYFRYIVWLISWVLLVNIMWRGHATLPISCYIYNSAHRCHYSLQLTDFLVILFTELRFLNAS